jgi:hypothetical protein
MQAAAGKAGSGKPGADVAAGLVTAMHGKPLCRLCPSTFGGGRAPMARVEYPPLGLALANEPG